MTKYTLAQLAKGIVSAIATIITIVTAALSIPGIIPLPWLPYIAGGVSILGTITVIIKGNEPILDGRGSRVESLAADVTDVRHLIAMIFRQLNPPSPTPREAAPVSVVVNTPTAAAPAPAAAEPAPVPQPEPAPGTYPDGPYLPPKPASTGPIPPVSEPVGATAVSATP